MGNFIEDCISGKATADDFDDYLDKWHDDAKTPSFKEFFGITFSEFKEVIKNHKSLKNIVQKYIERAKALERIFFCDNCGNISKGLDYGNELGCPKCFKGGCLHSLSDYSYDTESKLMLLSSILDTFGKVEFDEFFDSIVTKFVENFNKS